MDRKKWKTRIKHQMNLVGTYQKSFESSIDALAEILEQRDAAYQDFLYSGGDVVVKFISDRGASNMKKNPRLQVWMDLNTQALSFWKELGLTASGLKKINETAMKEEKRVSSLEQALMKLSG